jgi:hypothetical protein
MIMRNYTQEIRALEEKYAKVDEWARQRKEKISKKIIKLKKLQAQ